MVIVGWPSKKVYGNYRFQSKLFVLVIVNFITQVFVINVERMRVYIDKYRRGSYHGHSLGGGEEGKIGDEDSIAGTDTEDH